MTMSYEFANEVGWHTAFPLLLGVAGLLCGACGARVGLPRFVGGVITGVLLGGSVFGWLAPETYKHVVIGHSVTDRVTKEKQNYEVTRSALIDSGVSDVRLEEVSQAHSKTLEKLEQEHWLAQGVASGRLWRWAYWPIALVLLCAGLASGRKLTGHVLRDVIPPAVCLLAAFGVSAVVLGRPIHPLLDFSWLLLPALCVAQAACALPIDAQLSKQLLGNAEDVKSDLPQLATGVACAVTVFVAISLLLLETHDWWMQADPFLSVNRSLAGIGVCAALLLFASHRVIRWLQRRSLSNQNMDALTICVALSLVSVGSFFGWGLHAMLLGVGLAVSMREDHAELARRLLLVLGAVVGVYAGFSLDLLSSFDWLLCLIVLIIYSDVRALGAFLAIRLLGNRSWWDSLRVSVAISAGDVLPLTIVVILSANELIDSEMFTALVLAITLTGALALPMLKLIDRINLPQELDSSGEG